jgi:hypothetical protein
MTRRFESTLDPGVWSRMEGMSAGPRSTPDRSEPVAADVLRRFIEAIESGELLDSSPQDAVVVRRLEDALTDLETVPRRPRRESPATR